MKINNSTPHDADPDAGLMLLVQRGDHEAFTQLIHKFQDILLNFFRRMNVNNDAEDLVQETFFRIYRYRLRYRPAARFTTFLFRIARQVHIDWWRKEKKRSTILNRLLRKKEAQQLRTGAHKSNETVDKAEQALMNLPEAMRMVVVLTIYHDLKYAEIADVLEIPEGTVKSRMFHALRTLREMLNGQD